MKNSFKLLKKEFRLSTPSFIYIFLGFALMTFIPGYPILCGAFFVCMGMFQGYQYCRESNDILYSVLLPVKKTDVVRAKYMAAAVIEMLAMALMAVFSAIRMTVLADAAVYMKNVMMPANLVFLAFALLIFAAFNVIFMGMFFKTAYNIGRPFIIFIIACFSIIGIGESLHHIPVLPFPGRTGIEAWGLQTAVFAAAIVIYIVVTIVSCRRSEKRFETIDM